MAFAWTPIAAYDVAAGLILVALTAVVVAAGFSKRSNQLFALYLLCLGLSTLFAGLVKASAESSTAYYFAYLNVWAQVAVVPIGVAFAARFPRRERIAASFPVTVGLFALAIVFYGLYLVDHTLFVESVGPNPAGLGFFIATGPLLFVVYGLTLASQALIFVLLSRAYLRETSEIKREQYWWVLAGLALFYTYNFVFSTGRLFLMLAAIPPEDIVPFLASGFDTFQYAMGIVGLVVVAIFAFRTFASGGGAGDALGRRSRSLLKLLALPLATAAFDVFLIFRVFEGAVPSPVYQNSQFVWRLGLGVALTYATLKYELFDLDLRLKRGLENAIAFGGAAGLFITVDLVLLALFGSGPAGLVIAQVASVGAVIGAFSLFRKAGTGFAGRVFAQVEDSPSYVIERKIAVYRAALEGLVDADGTISPDHANTLSRLRADLGLSDAEASVLEYSVAHASGRAADSRGALGAGGILLGKYRIEKTLGAGSFGRTYLCRDGTIGRLVAVKHLRPPANAGEGERLLREARTLGQLHHPNIILLYAAEEVSGELFLVMEYADGGSLRETLSESGALPVAEAARVTREVLLALRTAHAAGIVHRDVKPANVLLTSQGHAKLADFGLAREGGVSADATLGGFRSVGLVFGTPAYMAPEQARGSVADARSDLYAVGAVFYECLVGDTYLNFGGKTEFEMRESILRDPPRLPIKGVPAWANVFLEKALAKDAAHRFQSASEMLSALEGGIGNLARTPER